MSNSYDYELVIKRYRCKSICSKTSFYKNKSKKDGVNSCCKIFKNEYLKVYIKNRIKTDVSLRLIRNTRRRIHHALNSKLKPSSTGEVLGIDIDIYRKWIQCQMTPDMIWQNMEIDRLKPICMFNVSKKDEIKKFSAGKIIKP